MTLTRFVLDWSAEWATAPIYGAGVKWVDKKGVSHTSDGKQPLPVSRYEFYNYERSLGLLDSFSEKYKAIGLWFGERSRGLVCLDIDGNLDQFIQKHPEILHGAHILSPKTDRAKVLFQVPEELWSDVKGYDNNEETYQVLWNGKMGVAFGAYGAGGEYKYVPGEVPQAPDWLLEGMLAAKKIKLDFGVPNNSESLRSIEEEVRVIEGCLSVIPYEGGKWLDDSDCTDESWWWRIGCCIKGSNAGEAGFNAWEHWSQMDSRYVEDWQQGNPCEEKWPDLSSEGLTVASLIKLADRYDPERTRIQDAPKKANDFKELMAAVEVIQNLDDPSEINYRMQVLAVVNSYRSGFDLTSTYNMHKSYKTGSKSYNAADLLKLSRECESDFVIPDLLKSPSALLLHGLGGSGKTSAVWALIKKVLRAETMNIRNQEVAIKSGNVLWFNGDQNIDNLAMQADEFGITENDNIYFYNDVSLHWTQWVYNKIKQHDARVVVIDSITSCLKGVADQNKSEYSMPIYGMSLNNGTAFPPCLLIFIHHSNKEGGSRGSTSVVDAVDEVWSIRKPEEKDGTQKRILEIGKSRLGNEGRKFFIEQDEDFQLTYQDSRDYDVAGLSATDQLLVAMRQHGGMLTTPEILALPVVGKESTKKSSLNRLVNRGLVARHGSRRHHTYQAIGSCISPMSPPEGCATSSNTSSSNGSALVALSCTKEEKCETHKTDDELQLSATSETPSAAVDPTSCNANSGSYRKSKWRMPPEMTGA